MKKRYAVIDNKDRFFIEYDEKNNKPKFKKDILVAKIYNEKNEAIYEANHLKQLFKKLGDEDRYFKVAEISYRDNGTKIKILN